MALCNHQERSNDPTITAFERSPDRGKGLARDMRVRWALEEVGQPYDVRLLSFSEMKESAHRMLHPFGQIPTNSRARFCTATAFSSCGRCAFSATKSLNQSVPIGSARWHDSKNNQRSAAPRLVVLVGHSRASFSPR